MSVFMQWNMRGLQANHEELSLLLSQYHPAAVCIQETLLHSNKTASFKNMLSHWADTNGFKFSSSKTVCMHFCRLRSAHPNPELTLNGTLIPDVEQTKFLGVIFDNKLTFLPHIRYLKEKCVKALNLVRVVAHTSWGADQHTLLHLYRSLVRSKLDYGSVVYGSARESYLRI